MALQSQKVETVGIEPTRRFSRREIREHIVGGGYVYFVRACRSGMVKVGHARNVERRLKALRTSSPEPLELIAHMPGDRWLEARLHELLASGRVHGEWFAPDTPKLQRVIDGIKQVRRPAETGGPRDAA